MGERMIVVGGGAAGPSAAAKAKRVNPDLEVTILQAGEYVSFAS
jgi:protoporphyrinogen oxidase